MSRTPSDGEKTARKLAELILPKAKQLLEQIRDGGFLPIAFLRLQSGAVEMIAMPFSSLDEKVGMAEVFRAHVRKYQPVAYVVVLDSYMAHVKTDEVEEYYRKYRGAAEHPQRIEALVLSLHWRGGCTVQSYPYDRVAGKVVWRAQEKDGATGRVASNRFSSDYGVD